MSQLPSWFLKNCEQYLRSEYTQLKQSFSKMLIALEQREFLKAVTWFSELSVIETGVQNHLQNRIREWLMAEDINEEKWESYIDIADSMVRPFSQLVKRANRVIADQLIIGEACRRLATDDFPEEFLSIWNR